jgi:hypothetical protein
VLIIEVEITVFSDLQNTMERSHSRSNMALLG